MGRKGSQKNERKINRRRLEQAEEREQKARDVLHSLERLPVFSRPSDFDGQLKKLAGILKQATAARRKSETHSRRGKPGVKR